MPPNANGAQLKYYGVDSSYTTQVGSSVTSAGAAGLGYIDASAPTGNVYFSVTGSASYGALFNVVVEPYIAANDSSVAFSGSYSGKGGITGYSTYLASGAPASGKVSFSNLTGPVPVYITPTSGSGTFTPTIDPLESSDLSCPYSYANPVGLNISVSTPFGAYYTMTVQ